MGRQPASGGLESSSLRRGAWSGEEDDLLRQCIEKYGEGKWHRVPIRAGLNRCRKSCRLRWLNYLHPGIKKGEFEDDEVDLIKKLHKLLGNRWSLIAGRIPGRTANDIKNYWNTRFKDKTPLPSSVNVFPSKVNPIKPQPRSFLPSSIPPKHFILENTVHPQEQEGSLSKKRTSIAHPLELPRKKVYKATPSSTIGEIEELIKMPTNDPQIAPLLVPMPAEEPAEKFVGHNTSACWMIEESVLNIDDLLGDGDVWGYSMEMDNYVCR